jgi:hypothetical protein
MKSKYLLPNRFKPIGWIVLILSICYYILFSLPFLKDIEIWVNVFAIYSDEFLGESAFFKIVENDIFDEIFCVLFIIGACFVAFSKEKIEDEFISKIRLESLLWATYVNYILLLLAIIFVFGLSFFMILIFNMFTILIFFIIRFNWILYRSKRNMAHEK